MRAYASIQALRHMATESSDPAEDVGWADQSDYKEKTAETEDVVVPDGQVKFRIAKESPTRFAAIMEAHGLDELAENLDELPDQADLSQDVGEVETEEAGADEAVRTIRFMRDAMVPNVIKPKSHWANPDADAGSFDLSTLTDRDKMYLIAKITGQDPDELIEEAESRAEQFPG